MKYIAAYALLALSGKTEISADDLTRLLTDLDCSPEQQTVDLVVNNLKGKPIHEAVAEGLTQIASLSLGGGGGQAAGGEAEAEEKEEEKEVSEEEESVSMGGFFD
eukprot:NODE_8039_length_427_cov_19.224868_g7179_i0.p1 GENE.NODE_8039_length_427_cov_19.224868_g7179_i0~~NODE_8039_length_427_cov_19.224868_g7179_i0.p1  ORF type:complete len:115 (+),score=20.04 NODE_8039_length_427_cov_19.224868_g7179_i0:32-346(+)